MHRTNPLSTFAGAPSGARPGTLPHSPGASSGVRRTPSGERLARSSTSLYSGVLLRALNEGPRTTPWSTRRVRRGQRRSNRGARASGWDGSADFVDPAVWVRTAAVLDPEKFVTKAHGHRSRLTVADNPIPVGGLHPAHRRYHRGRAAGKSLG